MLIINKKIIILFFIFFPFTVFAFSPAPYPQTSCNRMQSKITQWFHDCGAEYNSEGHTPKIDTDSPSIDYQTAIKFLKDNEYLNNEFFKVNKNCEYDLKYLATGTKYFPDHHNIFYCKFHGSYDCNIQPSFPKELEKENRRHMIGNRISAFIFHNFGFIILGAIITVIIIVVKLIPSKKSK